MLNNNYSKMDKEKFKGYKVFCEFFKRIGLYSEFRIYQRTEENVPFKIDTRDPIRDFGRTSISHWLRKNANKRLKVNLLHPFIDFVREFHPEFSKTLASTKWHDSLVTKLWTMDKTNNIVDIEKNFE